MCNVRVLALAIIFLGCSAEDTSQNNDVFNQDSTGEIEYPLIIDGGKRVVYQFSKMTPRGPQYFLDTVEYVDGMDIPSLPAKFLFPITLSKSERNTIPAIVGISIPGYFEETIVAAIDEQHELRIRFKDTEYFLKSETPIRFTASDFKASFHNAVLHVVIEAKVSTTPTGTHRAGSGTLKIFERSELIQEEPIFLVCN